jgi:hypothetical protein
MNRLALTCLAALTLLSLPAHADKLDAWYKLLPKNTVGIMAVKSAPELLADWEKGGFARMMQDEEFLKWMAPSRVDGQYALDKQFKEVTGESMEDLLKHIQGSVLVAFAADSAADFGGKGAPFVMLMEAGDQQAAIEELIKKDEAEDMGKNSALKKIIKDVAGVPLHILASSEAPDATWKQAHAFVDGVMVMGDKPALVEHFIAALKSGTAETSEVVASHLTRLSELSEGSADITVYLNGETLMKWLQDTVAQSAKNGKASSIPMDPAMIFDALGVKELQSIGFMLDLSDAGSRVDMAILHPGKLTGFLSLLQGSSTSVTPPGFIPADVLGAQVMRQSLSQVWDGLLAMVQKLGPLAMMATMQIGQVETQIGFKIKEDLLASLADEYVQAEDGTALEQSQVVGFKVKDRARLAGALDGLKRFIGQGFGAFEESEYLGHDISTFKATLTGAAGKPQEIAYCLTDNYLFFSTGKQELLKKMLARMKDPGGPSIWDAPRTQELISMLPKNYVGLGISDASKQIEMVIEALATVQKQTAATKKSPAATGKKGPGKGPKKEDAGSSSIAAKSSNTWFDAKATPSAEMFKKYFGSTLSGTYSNPTSIHFRVLSKPVEAAAQ